MLWVVQNNYKRITAMTADLARTVRESGRPLRDFSLIDGPLPHYPEVGHLKPFLYGSTATVRKASLDPVYAPHTWFDAENMDQLTWGRHRQGDLLNEAGSSMTLGEFAQLVKAKAQFVRPLRDMKSFVAGPVTPGGYDAWFAGQLERNPGLLDDHKVWAAPIQEILSEYRFIVGDHQILAGSSYRLGSKGHRSTDIPPHIFRAAQQLALGWQPARLSVMDVCQTADGRISIVEFNCVHSAGRYAISPLQFIEVVEAFSKGI